MSSVVEDFAKEYLKPTRLITCILPDDGTDRELIKILRKEKAIEMAESTGGRGQFISKSETKITNGSAMKMLQILVDEAQVESLFPYICEKAKIGRPNGGYVSMGEPIYATPYALPTDIPAEES